VAATKAANAHDVSCVVRSEGGSKPAGLVVCGGGVGVSRRAVLVARVGATSCTDAELVYLGCGSFWLCLTAPLVVFCLLMSVFPSTRIRSCSAPDEHLALAAAFFVVLLVMRMTRTRHDDVRYDNLR